MAETDVKVVSWALAMHLCLLGIVLHLDSSCFTMSQ